MRAIRISIMLSALGLLGLAAPGSARADIIQLAGFEVGGQCFTASPCLSGQVVTQGFANNGTPPPQDLQILSSPYTVVVGQGLGPGGGPINTLTYSSVSGGTFQFRVISNFSPFGTSALYNQGSGAVTLDFAAPVSEFGFQAQNFNAGSTTFFLQAFDGLTPLGTFSATGSTVFLGLRSDAANITRILISSVGNNFAVGETHISYTPSTPSGVPEPATFMLLGSGLAGAAILRRRRRKAVGGER
jgi:hypothetical protein